MFIISQRYRNNQKMKEKFVRNDNLSYMDYSLIDYCINVSVFGIS